MHRPIKTSAGRNAEDVDGGAAGSMIAPTETKTVASNSLIASTGSCYEVFLSFRGPDTRKGFTDHLYHGLLNAGIYAFRDDDKLCKGENIRPELLAAIRNSKILIPILSMTYGTSSWCLDELVQIMDCKNNKGQIVLPIFYKVKPADVGHQIGSFGDAFHERERRLLERRFNPTILEKWKQALLEISKLKGYEADGYEAELVKSVVQKVLTELKKRFELVISENLVGIDSHVNKVMEFVDNKSDATLFVGIHGMGGIGKTTLAKTIYNKLSNQFEHRSFIADIRESWKRNGVHYLQNQLIDDIFNQENEVCNADAGTKFISSMFKSKKVLILLDDVDDVVQLKSLAGNCDWFSFGSKIIITTRNKRVLEEVGVDHYYEHKEMDENQSLILFSKHAFRRDSPPREFEDLTHEVVSIAGGLPLSLEVFGSLLCGKESRQWKDTIKKLKKVPPMKVQEKLRISYEALDYRQKQIFLDIACFFVGVDKRIPSYMWDACDFFPEEGIEVLIFMSLIKVGSNHMFIMHDQLRDLGREIVREENQWKPWCRSRLWDYEEVQKVLKESKGTGKIEGINLSKGNSEGLGKIARRDGRIYAEKQFKNLTSLKFLHLDGAHLSGDFKDSMEELRWLRWPYCLANFEVNNFGVKELAVLELEDSEINEKWEGWNFFMMAKKLKYLNLCGCRSLENTDFLSAFKKLEVLTLNGCNTLKRIDASIGDMEALLRLELAMCLCLRDLPTEIGKLKSLQQLNLRHATSLFALPNGIGSLENLEILDISYSCIEELPNGIGSLRKLQELHAYNCRNLKGIMVESMCNLSSLRRLDFRDCNELQSLPDLPSGITYLGVTCRSHKLPSLSHLAHLKELQVWGCGFLWCIQELPSM
ncbi:disease resistance protein RUN1 [Eucalyptus grandis]|uniref:disease resistance protein RUN1 n=1 Tax=Eucalyptus grandis TaxID=71139 RepID=UPI00192EE41C|nr:disease resistance protein RUN1 [Eucalyptus grandis]XP_039168020.1 disease resistance protein RUN1 [Eucalyptus grandis]